MKIRIDMSNNILWYQPAKLSDDDVVVYNGKILSLGIERNQYFQKLLQVSEKVKGKERPWCGKINRYFFMKGSFSQQDELGRPISFMFVSDEQDYESALFRELNNIGFTLADSTKSCLNDKKNKNRIKCILSVIVVSVLLAGICYMVISYCNASDEDGTNNGNQKTEMITNE